MTQRLENPELTRVHHHMGVEIGLDIICRVARLVSEEERRAMIWLAQYARVKRSTPDQIATQLNLDRRTVRACLTDPTEDRSAFVVAVGKVRAEFEASLAPLVENSVTRPARKAVRFATRHCSIVECVGPSRMGKTVVVEQEWYKLLDRAIYVHCPTQHGERELQNEIARAMGISITGAKNGYRIRAQIENCFAPDLINLIIFDEAHRLWPRDPRECTPKRIEYVRSLHRDGKGASVLVVATPQFSIRLLDAMQDNSRWSPDQWYGRRVPFYTPETMSADELTAIARHHAPEFDAAMIELLVEQALACNGFCGLMVNSILLARDNAEDDKLPAVTYEVLQEAVAQMVRGTLIEQMAEQAQQTPTPAPRKRQRRALTSPPVARLNGAGHPPATPVFTAPNTLRV